MTTTRSAGAADASLVGRLLHEFNIEFGEPTPSAAAFSARFEHLLRRPDVIVHLAEHDGTAAGFAFLTLRPTPYADGPLAQLEELYVVPALRDGGIGTILLGAAVTDVRTKGAAEVHINVDEGDTDTRRFYERHGFVNVHPGTQDRMLCYLQEW